MTTLILSHASFSTAAEVWRAARGVAPGRAPTTPHFISFTDPKTLSIEMVRDLQQALSTSPVGQGGQVVCIWPAERLSIPAQQALLKLLEEPPERTEIILVARSSRSLLPTILSRCQVQIMPTENIQTHTHTENEPQPTRAGEQWWHDFLASTTLTARVRFTASLPTTRDEARPLLLAALQAVPEGNSALSPQTLLTTRQRLSEAFQALENNVSPALCWEHAIL